MSNIFETKQIELNDRVCVRIDYIFDTDPDLSYYGKYTNNSPHDTYYIDRKGYLHTPIPVFYTMNFDSEGEADDYCPVGQWIEYFDYNYTDDDEDSYTVTAHFESYKVVEVRNSYEGPRNYRYFVPELQGETGDEAIRIATVLYDRMEAYNNGDWHMMGIEVTLVVDDVDITSESIWGIESDDKDGIKLYEDDLIESVKDDGRKILSKLGEVTI